MEDRNGGHRRWSYKYNKQKQTGFCLNDSVSISSSASEVPAANGVTVLPLVNLGTLLDLHGALSNALTEVRYLLHSPSSAQVETIHAEIVSLMSEKEAKAGEAIWSMMENYRTRVLESIDGGDDDSSIYVFGCW